MGSRFTNSALGDQLARTCLTEGDAKVISSPIGLVTWHLNADLDAIVQVRELPAGNAHLHTSLTNVDGDALTHGSYSLAGAGDRSRHWVWVTFATTQESR